MHSGHRKRMLEKLKNAGDSLTDHELLEIYLFNAYPRINTNPIAHSLINTFGSLEGVLNADIPSLMQVENVGLGCASYIAVSSLIIERLKTHSNPNPSLRTFQDFKNYLQKRFKNVKNEEFVIFFLNKRHKVINEWKLCDYNENTVNLDIKGLSKLIGLNKPYSIVVAHNHISGNAMPTKNDDSATASIALLLSVNGVHFFDHIIVADNDVYSYHLRGRLKEICKQFNIHNITENLSDGGYNFE